VTRGPDVRRPKPAGSAIQVRRGLLRHPLHTSHLGGFAGNLAMGLLFGRLYQRWGRCAPLVVAHALIDVVAFVGYAALAGRVSWLPVAPV